MGQSTPGSSRTLLTAKQAADRLQVPVSTIYCWSSRGLLDSCRRKVGRHLRFDESRLFEMIDKGELKWS